MNGVRVVFMGTPLFATNVLKELIDNTNVVLVVSQKDSLVGRKKEITPSPVKKLAIENDIPVFTPDKIREDFEIIRKMKPDLIVTCAYGQILPEELLAIPTIASINVHASLLPKYRGGAPIQRAILNGEKETGITIMYMDKGMDSGDIISTKSIVIEDDDNLETLSNKLSELGSKLLIETLPSIVDGTNKRIKQNEDDVTFAPIISKEDEYIDFNETTISVYNKIRALNPNPGAYFKINGEIIKVYEAKIGEKRAMPSDISNLYKDGIGIGTKDGEIIITRIQPAGKKIMNTRDYLNGINKEELLRSKINERFME